MYKFSIITPTLNQSKYIRQTIDSVLLQDYENLELIVVDGGSSDGTLDILKEYREIKWISEPDSGAANALNKGFKMADGDIIAWLNSDDYYDENAISTIAKVFESDENADLVYGNLTFVDEKGNVLFCNRTEEYKLETLVRKYADIVRQPCTFFKKELLDKTGYLDESLKCVFDYDLFVRFLRSAHPKHIDANIAFYRDYKDTLTRKYIRRQGKEIIKVSRRNGARIYDKIVLSSFIKKILFPDFFY